MNKKFTIHIWDKLNIIFSIFSLLTFIPFGVFFILSLFDIQNGFFLGMSGLFASLFSAFFIAIVVRFVDLQKKKDSEEKALLMLNGQLEAIFSEIQTFYPQTKAFAKINENHTVNLPKEIIYCTDIEKEGMRDFIDFKQEFLVAKRKLDEKIEKCINSPVFAQCNIEVINLVANLQNNGFTRDLYNIATTPSTIAEEQIQYGFIFTEEKEFEALFIDLGLLLRRKTSMLLRELTSEEKTDYLKFIEETKKTLKGYNLSNGKTYLGNKRIT